MNVELEKYFKINEDLSVIELKKEYVQVIGKSISFYIVNKGDVLRVYVNRRVYSGRYIRGDTIVKKFTEDEILKDYLIALMLTFVKENFFLILFGSVNKLDFFSIFENK